MVSDNTDNISHRVVICYLGLKGLTPKEIHADMVIILGENTPSYSMVKKWDAEFKCGRDSLKDDLSLQRPHRRPLPRFIMADRRVTEYYIATELGISLDLIYAVIHNELHLSKVSARCVPNLLGPDLDSAQRVKGKSCHDLDRSQQFSSEICDYRRDLGPSLPTRNKATIETMETPRFSAS